MESLSASLSTSSAKLHKSVWCKGDQQLMDECFRTSGRMRSKWDEVHYSNGDTYRERHIRIAYPRGDDTLIGDTYNIGGEIPRLILL
ncbi:phage NrS-1 polymerase family protein [Halonotius terrestris]|uniref:phage NrS-1 polymerase family protein n=1 Tax=Halonotius terrestris TaxID=2487750 RepID=UPI003744058E